MFTEYDIEELAYDGQALSEGYTYFANANVTSASVTHDDIGGYRVATKIQGKRDAYAVSVRITKEGMPLDWKCECRSYRDPCKHVVALLYYILDSGSDLFKNVYDSASASQGQKNKVGECTISSAPEPSPTYTAFHFHEMFLRLKEELFVLKQDETALTDLLIEAGESVAPVRKEDVSLFIMKVEQNALPLDRYEMTRKSFPCLRNRDRGEGVVLRALFAEYVFFKAAGKKDALGSLPFTSHFSIQHLVAGAASQTEKNAELCVRVTNVAMPISGEIAITFHLFIKDGEGNEHDVDDVMEALPTLAGVESSDRLRDEIATLLHVPETGLIDPPSASLVNLLIAYAFLLGRRGNRRVLAGGKRPHEIVLKREKAVALITFLLDYPHVSWQGQNETLFFFDETLAVSFSYAVYEDEAFFVVTPSFSIAGEAVSAENLAFFDEYVYHMNAFYRLKGNVARFRRLFGISRFSEVVVDRAPLVPLSVPFSAFADYERYIHPILTSVGNATLPDALASLKAPFPLCKEAAV